MTYPIEPPGGTIATNRSNALQLLVYMSRTSARGTSAFLMAAVNNVREVAHNTDVPASERDDVAFLFAGILCGVGIEVVQAGRNEVRRRRHHDVHGSECEHGV